ncbi:hypothetical protein CHS0354_031687 [Potamilus streckersoni]|uniref:Cation/H+ exchanger transmembrane domain-containing protein n=1 Tax=Potamilus streckersoni TaxID=2493646 RepID=A0AAE0VZX9_9BIVA|nr:hypothetical protein CHS0354_031687 [Potamilus streckersoni]
MFFLMSYMSFQAAESAGLTGIVAVLFCGITQAHYTYNNLSSESRQRTKQLFEIGNFLAENFVFLYIGVSVFTLQKTKWDPGFIFAAFFAIIVARIINIYPLSLLLNAARKKKINFKMQHMMMFAGLRGALAFALSIRDVESEAHQMMVVATMMIVLVTVILCGGLTTPMLQWLQIRVGVEEEEQTVNSAVPYQRQYSTMQNTSEAQSENTASGPEQAEQEIKIRSFGKAYLIKIWYNFDMKYMKPFLTNSRPTLMDTLPKCCLPIAKLLTTAEQLSQGVIGGGTDGDSDAEMIIDHSEASLGENSYVSPSLNSPNTQDGTTRDPLEVELHAV